MSWVVFYLFMFTRQGFCIEENMKHTAKWTGGGMHSWQLFYTSIKVPFSWKMSSSSVTVITCTSIANQGLE